MTAPEASFMFDAEEPIAIVYETGNFGTQFCSASRDQMP